MFILKDYCSKPEVVSIVEDIIADVSYHVREMYKYFDQERVKLNFNTHVYSKLANSSLKHRAIADIVLISNELTKNALQNRSSKLVNVDFVVGENFCTLVISNDGELTNPDQWISGLGMTIVKKRIASLGGNIAWKADVNGGVSCRVIWSTKNMCT